MYVYAITADKQKIWIIKLRHDVYEDHICAETNRYRQVDIHLAKTFMTNPEYLV